MMNLKASFKWIARKASNYNLFMLGERDYDDDDEIKDPAIVLTHQKYKTRFYVALFTRK